MSFRRGSVKDLTVGLGVILGGAITFLLVNTVLRTMDATSSIFGTSTLFDTFINNSVGILDSLFVLGFFGMFIAAILLAASVRSTPIYFAVTILFIILAVFISPTITTVYEEIAGNAGIAAGHSTMDTFFSNLPLIILVVGGLIVLVQLLGGSGSE